MSSYKKKSGHTQSRMPGFDDDWFGTSDDSGVSTKGYSTPKKCHDSHKELTIGDAPGVILGASCNFPRPGYDVYVGFDWGMKLPFPPSPWNPAEKGEVDTAIHAKFEIPDMQAPTKARTLEFKRMIDWLEAQLRDGKRVHIGCIGGHGRTGLVLAALVKQMTGNEDAVTWVRENHCKKAVETVAQIEFLHDNYGIKKVGGSKNWGAGSLSYNSGKGVTTNTGQGGGMGLSGKGSVGRAVTKDEFRKAAPERPQTTSDVWADGKELTPLLSDATVVRRY